MYKAMHQSMAHSEKLAALSDFAHRVWTCGVVAADMVGRITAIPVVFHAKAFPLILCDREKIKAAFEELKAAKLCHFYEVEDKPYMVFHDHDEHNKTARNLRNIRPSCPPPMPGLCYCVVYTPKEEGDSSTPVPTAVVPEKRGSVGERRASNALAQLWNDGPGEHLNGKAATEKIQAAIDVGVDPQLIEQHFWDHQRIKGRKIWEVLDPLRPATDNGVPSMDKLLDGFAKEMKGK